MATSSHLFSSISRGGTQWVYGGRLFVVSARTNKRLALTSSGVPGRPLGNPPVVGFNLGHGGVPRGRPVARQLCDTLTQKYHVFMSSKFQLAAATIESTRALGTIRAGASGSLRYAIVIMG